MKYYFITYQATNSQGSLSIWNQVIDSSPMKFIKALEYLGVPQELGNTTGNTTGHDSYYGFVVINTVKISKADFIEYEGKF